MKLRRISCFVLIIGLAMARGVWAAEDKAAGDKSDDKSKTKLTLASFMLDESYPEGPGQPGIFGELSPNLSKLIERIDKAAADESALAARAEREDRKAKDRDQRKLRKDLAALEKRIVEHEARQATLSAQIEEAFGAAGDRTLGERLSRELTELHGLVAGLYVEWETLSAAAE